VQCHMTGASKSWGGSGNFWTSCPHHAQVFLALVTNGPILPVSLESLCPLQASGWRGDGDGRSLQGAESEPGAPEAPATGSVRWNVCISHTELEPTGLRVPYLVVVRRLEVTTSISTLTPSGQKDAPCTAGGWVRGRPGVEMQDT
jgi:hypothetical protein